MNSLEQLLSAGYSIAPVTAYNDVPPSGLAFRDEPFSDSLNVAITCPNLLVVRKSILSEDERDELAGLFIGAPRIDAAYRCEYLVMLDHFCIPPRTKVETGLLSGCELRREALAPPSVLLSVEGLPQSVKWAGPHTIPTLASRELVEELSRACVLPPNAWVILHD